MADKLEALPPLTRSGRASKWREWADGTPWAVDVVDDLGYPDAEDIETLQTHQKRALNAIRAWAANNGMHLVARRQGIRKVAFVLTPDPDRKLRGGVKAAPSPSEDSTRVVFKGAGS